MAYVIARSRKAGTRYTGMYLDPDGAYKSAGTFDTPERAQEVAQQNERHHRLQLAETSPADKATILIEDFGVKFLKEHAIEPNSKMTYAQLLHRHIYPYIGKRRVAEISRETIHRLLTVVLPEAGASRATVINTRTCLSAMLQMVAVTRAVGLPGLRGEVGDSLAQRCPWRPVGTDERDAGGERCAHRAALLTCASR